MNVQNVLSITLILFSVIDIIGNIPVIIDLKKKGVVVDSVQAALVSMLLMVAFLYAGEGILKLFGLGVQSFAVAGAIFLFFLGLVMILGVRFFRESAGTSTGTIVPIAFVLGHGFSGNGDHIAFLAETKERVNLTYGPVTTSFAWFGSDAPQAQGFHNVEDQGVPRSMSPLAGHGVEIVDRLAHDRGLDRWIAALGDSLKAFSEIFASQPTRTYGTRGPADLSLDRPEAEDELSIRMMCVVAQGRDAADGRFRLEEDRLRVSRPNGQRFVDDPIYRTIEGTLEQLAAQLRPAGSQAGFIAPLSDGKLPGVKPVVLTSHPLGGCPMGETVASRRECRAWQSL